MTNPFKRPPKVDPLRMFEGHTGDAVLVEPEVDENGRGMVVILERVEPGLEPEYCVHGKVSCYRCDEWCWLGDKTYQLVRSGRATGICIQCAEKMNVPGGWDQYRVGNVGDHQRKDGPH